MNNFRTNFLFSSFFILSFFFISCSKSDDTDIIKPDLETKIDTDIDVSTDPVLYSLSSGKQVAGDDIANADWDLQLSGTTISFNTEAGVEAQFVTGTFESVILAPESGYLTDDITGSGSWYTYTGTEAPQHAILAIPGKILVIKTANGNYAKLEIISYYKGNPDTSSAKFSDVATRSESSFYTIKYAYQKDGTTQ